MKMIWRKIVMPLLYLVSQPSAMKNVFTCLILLLCCNTYSQTLVIHFDFDRYDLRPEAKMELDSFFSTVPQAGTSVHLEGHCDFIGSDDYNDKLSLKRVEGVKKYLETKYPAWSNSVDIAGFGEKKPLNENKNAVERSMNRRVEITIMQVTARKETVPEKKTEPTLKQLISDTALKTGSSIAIHNINFEGGRHVFLPEAYPALQELVDVMIANPTLVIEIDGHICCTLGDGDAIDADTRTFTLSHERAKAVYSYLVSHGINAVRLSYKGFGHSRPIHPYPEQDEDQRIANRRVEIKIISK